MILISKGVNLDSGKLDNPLNLALNITNEQREQTLDLEVGFDQVTQTWELIVKYNGDLSRVARELDATYVPLLNGYAILTIKQNLINQLILYEEIEFIEKPTRLFFELFNAKIVSCISPLQSIPNQTSHSALNLSGQGILVAIVDSGIDYMHPDFRNEDGSTRILKLWDQTLNSTDPPPGFTTGSLFTEEQINVALSQQSLGERLALVPSTDRSSHGTSVAGIACGNGRASNGRNRGVAYKSTILVVKLGTSINRSFPRTTQLMEAVDFCVRTSLERNQPIAINLSFGNNYGSHDGNSLVERYLDDISGLGRSSICIGTGNEGASAHHVHGTLYDRSNRAALTMRSPYSSPFDPYLHVIEIGVGENESTLNLQLWKNYFDLFDVTITAPSSASYGPIQNIPGTQQFTLDQTDIMLYYGEPKPYNKSQELYFEFIPHKSPSGGTSIQNPSLSSNSIAGGIWRFTLAPRSIVTGNYSFYLPTGEVIGPKTRFLRPTELSTLTIPSTASRVLSVGAYDSNTDRFAYFSGRGYALGVGNVKPDIVAPGVGITTASPGGSYSLRTGTSFATPFATGSAALLMQWGILQGNDPYLYGEKIKAYFISGARHLAGEQVYPNPSLGYGALCVADSLPI